MSHLLAKYGSLSAYGERQRRTANERNGGGSGIRTHDTVSRIHAFQACAFSHSAIPPRRARPKAARHKSARTIVAGGGVATRSRPPPTARSRPQTTARSRLSAHKAFSSPA